MAAAARVLAGCTALPWAWISLDLIPQGWRFSLNSHGFWITTLDYGDIVKRRIMFNASDGDSRQSLIATKDLKAVMI